MDGILVGVGVERPQLLLRYANRHGLVAGATGTGKTVTLQTLAEGFARAGVPVFCADIKGDLAGLARPGRPNPKIDSRVAELKIGDFAYAAAPVIFWDLEGKRGHPLRATVAEMGPLLLARMLELNEVQEGVLNIAFALADEEGLLLLDFKDLVALLQSVAERAGELTTDYGNISKATVGTIQRRLLTLEQQGGENLFGEPALELADLMLRTPDGRGAVNVLVADRLMQTPRLYATFLLWLLSELFEELPEVGDLDRPKLVFFFDEAHLLFRDAPKALIEKVEQVVRLIRSKGVGVYFVTQSPQDVPPTVLAQLGNRVQHALRAFTPVDQKAVRVAAETFRANPAIDTATAITELAVGEALVSMLTEGGVPAIVQQVKIVPPRSRIGAIDEAERQAVMQVSPLAGKYDVPVDRESAYEILRGRATTTGAAEPQAASPWGGGSAGGASRSSAAGGATAADPTARDPWSGVGRPIRTTRRVAAAPRAAPPPEEGGMLSQILLGSGRRQGLAEAVTKSLVRSVSSQVGSSVGRAIVRGVLGSIVKR